MNNKLILPSVGFGTYLLSGKEAQKATKVAIDCGYRLIDTGALYGNEIALRKAFREHECNREDLIITSKLWNSKRKYEDAITSCKQSLKRLGLDYLDLYLVHWPASPAIYENWREINADCWRAMETLKLEGLVKNIGVCNYLPHHIDELMKTAKMKPAVNQIELHPGFLKAERLEYCQKMGITVEAWSPLGKGSLLHNETLEQISTKYEKSTAQICLRWCIQHGATALPKSAKPERIRENIDVFDFKLSNEDMQRIDAMPFSGGSGFDPETITICD